MRQLVYIAAPYAAPTSEEIEENIRRVVTLAQRAVSVGLCPIIPHLPGRAGVYGHHFEADDGTSRRVALECGATMAHWVGSVGGQLWVILRDDGTMSPGTQVEYDAFHAAPNPSRRWLLSSRTWESWQTQSATVVSPPVEVDLMFEGMLLSVRREFPDVTPEELRAAIHTLVQEQKKRFAAAECTHGASGGNVGFANGSCTNCGAPDLGFYMADGEEGGPLGCDCYGGCWGDHSVKWPKIIFLKPATSASGDSPGFIGAVDHATEAHRLCHQEKEKYISRPATERVPYGSYVLVGAELRFATHALRNAHEARLRALWRTP